MAREQREEVEEKLEGNPPGALENTSYSAIEMSMVRSAPTEHGWRSLFVMFMLVLLCGSSVWIYVTLNARDVSPVIDQLARSYIADGDQYQASGEHNLAIQRYTRAIELQPDNAELYYKRGVSYQAKGDKSKASADFQKVLTLNPSVELRQKAEKTLQDVGSR